MQCVFYVHMIAQNLWIPVPDWANHRNVRPLTRWLVGPVDGARIMNYPAVTRRSSF